MLTPPSEQPFSRSGFSLVELSIVLVILGLLTGGILTGQNLIRAAELRNVLTEREKIVTAAQTFRSKYFYLPGDLPNATNFWGADTSCPLSPVGAAPKTSTCNGNGDGEVGKWGGAGEQESFRFWQHLANAGMIEGQYSGTPVSGDVNHTISTPGVNILASKSAGNSGWHVTNYYQSLAVNWMLDGDYNNMLTVGIPHWTGSANYYIAAATFSAEESWHIDQKVDDGRPGTGKVTAAYNPDINSSWAPCLLNVSAGTESALAAEYDLDDPAVHCNLIFPNAF